MVQIRKAKDGWEYATGVQFSARIIRGDIVCAACHASGNAIHLKYPKTLYFDYRNLSTEERGVFLCARCTNKLLGALNNIEDDYKGIDDHRL